MLVVFSFVLCAAFVNAENSVDAERGRVVSYLSTEPPNLDSAKSTDIISNTVLSHVMEGLLQADANGRPVAGMAERWELRNDGASFWLRKDAKWSDGKPVTAHDFVYAWKKAVNPETASPYAFILYPIKNAEQINQGNMPLDTMGVRAVSDRELQVVFENRCPYFLSLVKSMTYFPQRQDVVERYGRAYAADADKMVYNGRFTISKWVHSARLTLSKNDLYWNASGVRLKEIDYAYITSDLSANFNLFKNGSVAHTLLDNNAMEDAIAKGYALGQFATGSIYFLEFNFAEGHVTQNKHYRKALQALLDPALLVNKVIGRPGTRAAYSIFPSYLNAAKSTFAQELPPKPVQYGLSQARELFEKAKQELADEPWSELLILTSDSAHAKKQAQYYQYLIEQGLGINVRINSLSFKQYIQEMRAGKFDIALAGWGPDFDDPITYGDLFASWNPNNRGKYVNPKYDAAVRVAQNSLDSAARFTAFKTIQDIITEDVPIIPTYERFDLYVEHPSLKGVTRLPSGADPDLRHAWIEE